MAEAATKIAVLLASYACPAFPVLILSYFSAQELLG
jgi:hypothetical protein